jgi:hypothetical protein
MNANRRSRRAHDSAGPACVVCWMTVFFGARVCAATCIAIEVVSSRFRANTVFIREKKSGYNMTAQIGGSTYKPLLLMDEKSLRKDELSAGQFQFSSPTNHNHTLFKTRNAARIETPAVRRNRKTSPRCRKVD